MKDIFLMVLIDFMYDFLQQLWARNDRLEALIVMFSIAITYKMASPFTATESTHAPMRTLL
jgi:hypothetical protein